MKHLFARTLAVGLILFSGVIAPAFNVVTQTFFVPKAFAAPTTPTPLLPQTPVAGPEDDPQKTTTETPPGTLPKTGGTDNQTENPAGFECDWTDAGCGIIVILVYVFGSIPMLLAAGTAMILDYVLWNTLSSATYTAQDGADSFVSKGWRLVRDFSNLLFIFALFAVGFSLVLNGSGTGFLGLDPKRTVATVIIMALLVNFSFLMCRIVIDVTNIIGNVFYTKITEPSGSSAQSAPGTMSSDESAVFGKPSSFYSQIGGGNMREAALAIAMKLNPQQLITQETYDSMGSGSFYILLLFVSFGSFIFNIFLIYIFGSSAMFLLGRTIGLYFLIILSPIAFVSKTIPTLTKMNYIGFDDWIEQLVKLAFSAPLFVFFLYLTVIFLNVPMLGSSQDGGAIVTFAMIMIRLSIVGTVLYFGKKFSQDMAGKIGNITGNAITSVAKGVAFAGAAVATGGVAGAARLGTNLVKEKVGGIAKDYATEKLGAEGYAKLQQQYKLGSLTNMSNPKAMLSSWGKVGKASNIPTGPIGDIANAYRQGGIGNRVYDIKKQKEAEEELKKKKDKQNAQKIKDVDKKIAENQKDFDDGLITKEDYLANKKNLNIEKRQITDPTAVAQQEVRDAREQLKKAQEEEKKGNYAKKIDANEQESSALGDKLKQAADALTDAAKKQSDAATNRAAVDVQVTTKQAELDAATSDHSTTQAELARTEQELAQTPKTGFGVDREKIANLENRRAALTQERDNHLQRMNLLTTDFNRIKTQQADLVKAEKDAENEVKVLTDKKNDIEQKKIAVDKTGDAIKAEAQAAADKVVDLTRKANNAQGALQTKKDVAKIESELEKATLTEKQDTQNRRLTQERVDRLKAKLRNITGGGTGTGTGGTGTGPTTTP